MYEDIYRFIATGSDQRAQADGVKIENLKQERIRSEIDKFSTDSLGILTRCRRVWVPDFGGIRQIVLKKAHKSMFLIQPGATKMYLDLRLSYWWPCMKREIAWYVDMCLTCRMVKVENQRPHSKL